MSALLEVEQLRVVFPTRDGPVRAVNGISYAIDSGRTLGVVGESGSGKSVAALTLLGLTRAQGAQVQGQARFDGQDLLALPDDQLRRIRGNRIAMIFQDPLSSLHPFYRVGDQLVEAIRIHGRSSRRSARRRAIELLELVGIPDPDRRIDQYPHEFSGGMRQRVMIAMALAGEPALLIADEPTTALDVTVQAQILSLLEELQRRTGLAIILMSHDLGVVAQAADRVAVMYAGRIVELAGTEQIFAAPQHPYTWGLLRSIPRLDQPRGEELAAIPGRPPSLIDPPSGCPFHPRCPYVRDAHKRIEPRPEAVPGEPGHEVACLLDPELRRTIWRGLQTGEDPHSLRKLVEEPGHLSPAFPGGEV